MQAWEEQVCSCGLDLFFSVKQQALNLLTNNMLVLKQLLSYALATKDGLAFDGFGSSTSEL